MLQLVVLARAVLYRTRSFNTCQPHRQDDPPRGEDSYLPPHRAHPRTQRNERTQVAGGSCAGDSNGQESQRAREYFVLDQECPPEADPRENFQSLGPSAAGRGCAEIKIGGVGAVCWLMRAGSSWLIFSHVFGWWFWLVLLLWAMSERTWLL